LLQCVFAGKARRKAALFTVVVLLAGLARPAKADQLLHLPYPAGTKVEIIQGYNAVTHVGVERYSLDLVRADGNTNGSPVFAPASGSVSWAQPPGGQNGCIGVSIDNDGDFHYMLCHIILNHAYATDEKIQVGQALGTVGAPGLVGNNGTSHIHMQLYTLPGGARTPQPYAPPDGIPLDGVTMSTDGSFNQWACPSLACSRLISTNPNSRASAADTGTAASVSASAPLLAGGQAVVAGTGDCLRVHSKPSMSSPQLGCIPDGTAVYLKDGPSQGDGHSWWDLSSLGWVVADYLQAAGAAAPPAPPTPPAPPASVSTGTASLPPAPPNPPALGSAGTSSADAVLTPPANVPSSALSGTSTATLAIGARAGVIGTGGCLRLHAGASLESATVACLADGTAVTLRDGPQSADGHDWWLLDAGGWAASDYLQAQPGP